MLLILLGIIFISFIGVGLPDSVLGAAWPAMVEDMGLPLSLAGYISAVVSLGTVVAGFFSTKLILRLGTGRVTAFSMALTALALLGFAWTRHPAFFFLLAIPLGLGGGAVDTALNSFVALHYSAAQMSYMHCFYGIGVAISPWILSLTLGDTGDWRRGYLVVAAVQCALTLLSFAALPLWKRVEEKTVLEETPVELSPGQLFRIPGVFLFCMAFFFACALELTAGSWSSSFFVQVKGVTSDRAAGLAMTFYVGLAAGRFLSGLLMNRLGQRRQLWLSLCLIPGAILLFLSPLPVEVSAAALLLIGLGVGPIYPVLGHLTPEFFGQARAQAVIGIQQAMTYVGILIMPTLFGVLADRWGMILLPGYLIAMFVLYAWMYVALMRAVKK